MWYPAGENAMGTRANTGNGRPPGTVGAWLRRHDKDPQEAGAILLAAIRRAGGRIRLPTTARDEVIAEVAARALSDGHAALRRARPSTPLDAWVRGCVRNVSLEAIRAREKEKEQRRPEEVPDSEPTPYEVAAGRDELKYERTKVMEAARAFPQPYGHVLYWRVVLGLPWQGLRDRLNLHRPSGAPPIGDRQTQMFITKAMKMLKDWLGGTAPRMAHRQKYLSSKNPWIDSTLPPLKSQIL